MVEMPYEQARALAGPHESLFQEMIAAGCTPTFAGGFIDWAVRGGKDPGEAVFRFLAARQMERQRDPIEPTGLEPDMDAVVRGTGHMVDVNAVNRYNQDVPQTPGKHLWTFVGVWKVDNPVATRQLFDSENMLTVVGPGCFWCEQQWSPTIGVKCPGDASARHRPQPEQDAD